MAATITITIDDETVGGAVTVTRTIGDRKAGRILYMMAKHHPTRVVDGVLIDNSQKASMKAAFVSVIKQWGYGGDNVAKSEIMAAAESSFVPDELPDVPEEILPIEPAP